ncbi:hypothetical protein HD806DRAFT_530832 [Xylariaceae sp. AK1471]|nr:hypothetical protein HD806DRAFT_530832 [Xylariaceae sp. AK1471]
MLCSSLLLLPAFGLLAQATESYSPVSALSRRRQLMTCGQTYGNGSIPCGGPQSTLCFNPGLGQTCCDVDRGFCGSGSYCAPVAGYCCLEGEDLTTCAENAGFDLPSSATGQITTTVPTMVTSARASRTFTVTPFLAADPGPTLLIKPDTDADPSTELSTVPSTEPFAVAFTEPSTTTCHETPSFTTPVVMPVSTTSLSPIVQVSVAVKENRALISTIAMVAVAGVFTIFL